MGKKMLMRKFGGVLFGKYISIAPSIGIIQISSDYGATFTASNSISAAWCDIDISTTGQYQIAGIVSGAHYYSNDYGVNWTLISRPTTAGYTHVSVSGNGQYMSTTSYGGGVYMSSDYGATWALKYGNANWRGCSLSETGQYQMHAIYNTSVRISHDYGATLIYNHTGAWRHYRNDMSSSGQYMTIAGIVTQGAWVSDDFGATFTKKTTYNLYSIAISETGQYQVAINTYPDGMYMSSDYGETWGRIWLENVGGANLYASDIDISGDGSTIVITSKGTDGVNYISRDFGITFELLFTSTSTDSGGIAINKG